MSDALKQKATRWKVLSLMLSIALLGVIAFGTRAEAVPQPNMEAALGHLEQAKASLERAEHNKGGFRVRAIGLIDQAMGAVREGIAAGNRR